MVVSGIFRIFVPESEWCMTIKVTTEQLNKIVAEAVTNAIEKLQNIEVMAANRVNNIVEP